MQTTRGTPLNTRIGTLALVAAVVVGVDVVTKVLAVGYLENQPPIELLGGALTLTFLRNAGAAFGLAQGYTFLLALLSIGVVLFIIRMVRRLTSTGWAVALGLLLGGALGNLADRVFRAPGPLQGHVVDFLELPHWPVFNLADTAITCAAVLIVVLTLRGVAFDRRAPLEDDQRTRGSAQGAPATEPGEKAPNSADDD